MLKNTFGKRKYYDLTVDSNSNRTTMAAGQLSCPACSTTLTENDLINNQKVCPNCSYHFPITAWERIELIVDNDSFEEFNANLTSFNILEFPQYDEKLESAQQGSGLKEAIVTGIAAVGGYRVVLGVMEPEFMMASMGSVVGEKITRAAEMAMDLKCPLVLSVASGGARMQEGMVSLMQMAKTSAVIERFHRSGLFYISLFTHPTTGGVYASFAALADIILAEPGALIGFTGPRVIEQTIKQKLPDNFQRAEFLLSHGMLDRIVDRSSVKVILTSLLKIHQGGQYA